MVIPHASKYVYIKEMVVGNGNEGEGNNYWKIAFKTKQKHCQENNSENMK